MPGPSPKPVERRQHRARGDLGLVALDGGEVEVPAPPKGVLKATRDWWTELWTSPLAQAYETTDVPSLRRLAELYDERKRAYDAFKRQRLTAGSSGQPRLNPLGKFIHELDVEIRNLEDRFGLSPMSRLKLGVQFGEAHKSLEALNEAMNASDERDPREGLEATPDLRAAGH